jgi:DNA-binding HxlR family transcriptional regulator
MAAAKKRSYGEACRFAHALDLVGERWALLVVRELLLGPKRFTDLRRGLPHASTNILAERLRDLEDGGVIRKRKLPPPAAASVYELTEWGADLEPVVTQLGAWGARSPSPPCTEEINADSIVLALRSLFDATAAADARLEVGLQLDGEDFRVVVDGGELEVARKAAAEPDASLIAAAGSFAAVLSGQLLLDAAISAGEVEVPRGRRALGRFLKLFPMPEPCPTGAGERLATSAV